jgi:hypothetical protein
VKKITPIYIPALHRELAPAGLPGAVLFLAPGFAPDQADQTSRTSQFYQPQNLPFSGTAARAVLREMLDLGSTLSRGGKEAPAEELRLIESGARAASARTGALGSAEEKELEKFSGGAATATTDDAGADLTYKELIRAQKILLLAWELEENLLEIKKAEASLAGQDRLLLSTMHGPEDEGGSQAAANAEPVSLAWPVLLEAAAPFLPDNALLFTANPELREALAALSPQANQPAGLPAEVAEALAAAPEFTPLLPRLLCARARLGDLVGGQHNAATRPWLDRIYNFALLPR